VWGKDFEKKMDDLALEVAQIRSEAGRLKRAARRLRQEATPAEIMVWGLLRGRRLHGLRFRRQHVLHGYIVDFYCHERRLCIELDGAHHLDADKRLSDQERDADLKSRGYITLRIMNNAALKDLSQFRDLILAHIRPSPANPPL
jgi:very-short-patch-repair endonuclease